MATKSPERMNIIDQMAHYFSLRQIVFALVLTFFLVSILFPFYWMVSSSFKTRAEIGGRTAVYVPGGLRMEAFQELFDPSHPSYQEFGKNIVNINIVCKYYLLGTIYDNVFTENPLV